MYSGKSGCNPAKVVVFGLSGCIWARVVVFGQKILYSGRSGCILAKWLFSGKVVVFHVMDVFVQNGRIRAKVVVCG